MNADEIWMQLQELGMMRIPATHGARRVVAKLRRIAERLEMDLTVAYDSKRKEYVLALDPLPWPKPPRMPKIPPLSLF